MKNQLYDLEHQAFKLGWEIIKHIDVAGDSVQAPGAVTMCNVGGFLPVVIHFFNAQDGGFHGGDYFKTQKDAEQAYTKRALRYMSFEQEDEAEDYRSGEDSK